VGGSADLAGLWEALREDEMLTYHDDLICEREKVSSDALRKAFGAKGAGERCGRKAGRPFELSVAEGGRPMIHRSLTGRSLSYHHLPLLDPNRQ
jgi:hypothetical protein